MDFLELAKSRYSVRKFKPEPVSDSDIEKILLAGQLAPTACNNQPQRIIVVKSEDGVERLKKVTHCHFDSKTALIVCYDKNLEWKREFDNKTSGDIDASIVTTHMMLEAANIGVGSTWVMYFIPEAVRAEFKLPDNIEPTAILVLGYPADDAKPAPGHTKCRNLDEIVTYDSF